MTEHQNETKSFVVGKASPVENRSRIANPAVVPPKIRAVFLTVALFLTIGLVSCANRTTQSTSTGESTNPAVSPSPSSSTPTTADGGSSMMGNGQGMTGEVDKQFIAMMVPHHEQANQMADLALTRAKRPEVKQLAQTIKKDQTREIEQMRTWYKSWYGTEVPAMATNGSDKGMMGSSMKGMSMDLETLKNAPDFDKEFLRQMISHHKMAIQMGEMDVNKATKPEIRQLAQSIVKTQTAEIDRMQKWYQAWYKSTP
jgi:uncharacterized protein (DUF305 family)